MYRLWIVLIGTAFCLAPWAAAQEATPQAGVPAETRAAAPAETEAAAPAIDAAPSAPADAPVQEEAAPAGTVSSETVSAETAPPLATETSPAPKEPAPNRDSASATKTKAAPKVDAKAKGGDKKKQGTSAAAPAEAPAPPPTPTNTEIAAIQDRIADLDAEIAEIEKAAPEGEGEVANPVLEFKRRARLLHQRRLSALKRIQQLEEQLAPEPEGEEANAAAPPTTPATSPAPAADPKADGPAPAAEKLPPIQIQEFDILLDELDAAQRSLQSAQQAASSQEEAASRANESRDNAGAQRRAAEEAYNAATQAGGGMAEMATLEEARNAETLADLQAKLEEALSRVAGLEVQLAEKGVARARAEVAAGAQRLEFSDEALATLVAEIAKRRTDLQAQLDHLYKEREKDSEGLYKRRQQLTAAKPEEVDALKEKVASAELALNTTNAGIQNLERRLNNLTDEEAAWSMRAQLMRHTLKGSRPRLLAETRDQLKRLRDSIAQVEARGRDVLASRLEIQQRLDNENLPEALVSALNKRLVAIDEQEEADQAYLSDMTRQEKLLRRLEWSLNREVQEQGWRAAYSVAREYFLKFWYYELFVYEDRGYTVSNIFYALIAYVITLSALLFIRHRLHRVLARILARRAGEDTSALRDAGLTFINGTSTIVLMVLSLYPTLRFLPLGERARTIIESAFFVAFVAQAALYLTGYMERSVNRYKSRRLKEDPSSVSAFGVMSFFGRIAIWAMVALVTLDSFGVNITTFVAGLGVGGIAVAFALQSILADIFSSVAILLDKPFVVGDVITVGDNTGEVQSIGLKTTRIKSVSGEQVVISNNDLLGSRIHNFKRMSERRILFTISVSYGTRLDHIELIPKVMQEAVEQQPKTRFSRAHFKQLGEAALIFECEYFMLEPDYQLYTRTHQNVNLHILKRFQDEHISFASNAKAVPLELVAPTLAVSAEQKPPKGMS